MKTLIDHNGCATYPYGSPALDVTVPMTVQGVDLLSVIKALTDRVSELELKLAAPQVLAQSTSVAAVEDTKTPDVIVPVETISEPAQPVLEAPVADPVADSVEAPSVAVKQTKKSSK